MLNGKRPWLKKHLPGMRNETAGCGPTAPSPLWQGQYSIPAPLAGEEASLKSTLYFPLTINTVASVGFGISAHGFSPGRCLPAHPVPLRGSAHSVGFGISAHGFSPGRCLPAHPIPSSHHPGRRPQPSWAMDCLTTDPLGTSPLAPFSYRSPCAPRRPTGHYAGLRGTSPRTTFIVGRTA